MKKTNDQGFVPTTQWGSVVFNGSTVTYLISFQKNPFFMGVVCSMVLESSRTSRVFSALSGSTAGNNECYNIKVRQLGLSQVGVTFRGIVPFHKDLNITKDACIRYADMYLKEARKIASKCGGIS